MKICQVNDVKIEQVATALPHQEIELADYVPQLVSVKQAKRLSKGTGFEALRISAADVTTSDLCTAAAERLLQDCNLGEIAGLVFVTQTPDYILPATSHILQDRLGLSNDVVCIDINQGCSGYVEGLYTASLLCKNLGGKVLLLAGDTISKLTSPEDRATRIIFGDAGTATLLSFEEARQCTDKNCLSLWGKGLSFGFASFGERASAIQVSNSRHRLTDQTENPGFLTLHGDAVMDFTLDDVYEVVQEFCRITDGSVDQYGLLAFHQANKMILSSLAEKLGVSTEKLPFTAGRIGNTSSASLPLILSNYAGEDRLRNVLCCGFGVGLSVGICVADFKDTKFYETVEV